LICAIPGLVVALLYAIFGHEPVRGSQDRFLPKADHATFLSLFRNAAFLCATFGITEIVFASGGISNWLPEFLHDPVGLSVPKASLIAGACTIVNGIAGTMVGCWIAQRWLRTNHRALYLLSFWSVALTLPFAALLFLGPSRLAVPSLFASQFFFYLNTGPLNTAIVNSVSAYVRATAVSVSLFSMHLFGDTFSPQIIGAIADRSNLRIGMSVTLIPLAFSCILLLIGARFAPRPEESFPAD
jgi:sugar phosphate permease